MELILAVKIFNRTIFRSSLFTTRVPDTNDTSATQTTRARQERHDCDTSETRATPVWHNWHDCDTSSTWTTRVRHKCDTNDTSVTRVKNFDFDKGTSENVFSHPYISYMANEKLQGQEQFISKNSLLETPKCI